MDLRLSRRPHRVWGLIPCLLLGGHPAAASLVINEFLADPAGADAGGEFVELLNTGPEPVDLRDVTLEFANGSVGPQWDVRWEGTLHGVLEAGQFFLIVDRNWTTTPTYDAQVALGLQNGPDAIRLARGESGLDTVGYGNLTDPAMLEGAAVPLPTGLGLGRRPDGHDTDNNAADFQPVQITPGWRNFPDHALEVIKASWEPPCAAESGQSLQLDLELRNTGLQDLPPTTLQLSWELTGGETLTTLETAFAGCATGEIWTARLGIPAPAEGRYHVLLELRAAGTMPALALGLGGMQVGPGDLQLGEVLHLPGNGQGEWLELKARMGLSTAGMTWRDEDGDWNSIPEQFLAAGERLVVAQDSTALVVWFDAMRELGIPMECEQDDPLLRLRSSSGGWPNLNNSAPEGRPFAERIQLADPGGVVIDQVILPADGEGGIQRGQSWERAEWTEGSSWRPSLAPAASTPGCLNSVVGAGPVSADLIVSPAVLDRQGASPLTHFLYTPPALARAWHVEVYDLWGERVRDLGGGVVVDGPCDLLWDGRGDSGEEVAAGAYVVVLLLAQGGGGLQPADRALVVVR